MKKYVKPLCIGLVVLSLSACQDDEVQEKIAPKPVKVYVVGDKVKLISRDFTGKALAATKAELSFEVPGKLIKLPVVEGTKKKKGELIAEIDSRRYQDKVSQEKAKFQLAKAQFDRAAALIKKNFISKNEYDILESNVNIAKANLSTAQKNLKDTVIYAPFEGWVAKKFVENFEYVKAKETVVSFHDLERMDIEIQLPEYIVLQAREEMSKDPVVIFKGVNKTYPIKFKEFSSKADPDTHTYRAVFTLQAPQDINMLPGMSVIVRIQIPDYKNNKQAFFEIPVSAVFSGKDDKPQVWVVSKQTNSISPQTVTVANMTGNSIKVLSGLKPGMMIVSAGAKFLRDGQKVAPIEEKH